MKTYTEWAVEWVPLDEDNERVDGESSFEPCSSADVAREIARQFPEWQPRVVHRTVTVTPWKYDVRDQPQG